MRPATRRYRAFVLLIAPLIWLVALIVFSRFVHAGGTGGVGAVIAGGSFLLALLFLLPVWIWRAKREERP